LQKQHSISNLVSMKTHRKNPARSFRKIRDILTAWENLAPDAEFSGMSINQFRDLMKPAADVREKIALEEIRLAVLLQERARIDENCLGIALRVVNGVRGTPDHGPNSPLYAAMGYIPVAMNKRGRPRKRKTNPSPPKSPPDAASP
jgi:hypothetical protein